MNRVVLTLSPEGRITSISSDQPVEVFVIASARAPGERVFQFRAVQVGAAIVEAEITGAGSPLLQ